MNSDKYIISIDKDKVSEMPTLEYSGSITLVDNAVEAHKALAALACEKAVGFDTETRPAFKKGQVHKVALMQISTSERCYLFRLNKIGICRELKDFIENPDILKIGLSVHDDFNVLRRSGDINPAGFIDLQEMVKKFDITDISLQKIYAILFGSRISKSQRLTNWEAPELTHAQQVYASIDAWACLKIFKFLKSGGFDRLLSPYRHKYEPPIPNHTKHS